MHTLIATFATTQSAETAVDRMVSQGIPRANVHVQSAPTGGASSTGAPQAFLASAENFFSHLFENTSGTDAGTYAEAVRRGSAVVTVDADSEDELEKARVLIGELDPLDVNERAPH